jgi:hypothetical protein
MLIKCKSSRSPIKLAAQQTACSYINQNSTLYTQTLVTISYPQPFQQFASPDQCASERRLNLRSWPELLWISFCCDLLFLYGVWDLLVLFKACRGVCYILCRYLSITAQQRQVTGPCCCLLFLFSRHLSQDRLFIASAWAEFIFEVRSKTYTVSGRRCVWEES